MNVMGRRGRGVVALAAVALLGATPGVASAAETPLPQPRVEDLRTGYSACAQGDSAPYVGEKPQLEVTLRNPDAWAWAGAEIEVWWTDAEGAERRETLTTTASIPGTPFRLTPSFDIPADTLVSWRARAVGEHGATSSWSDEADGHLCQFRIDTEHPEPATITSDRYDDTAWHDGVGVYGGFTFDSPSDDVVAYRYRFTGESERTVEPEEAGGLATIRLMPQEEGPDSLTVRAVDRAGNPSTAVTHRFLVAEGRAPVAHWKLTDASAGTGPALRAEDGVTFTDAGPYGTDVTGSAHLDGAGNGYLTTDAPVVDGEKTFAVGGWVRPGRTGRAMTVASQDAGDGTSAFTLGLRPTADGDADWAFTFGGATVAGGGPETGDWAHVLGVFDTEDDTLRLYVDGKAVGEPAKADPVEAPGAFQLGRARGDGGQRWQGDLADVRVWDRVVVGAEAATLAQREPQDAGAWDFESVTDGAAPGGANGPLTLHDGATVFRYVDDPDCWIDPDCVPGPPALVGDAHLELDGSTGHAATGGPVVDTSGSFTVAAQVRLADREPAGPMTVLSQGGEHGDAFKVRYDPAAHAWQLVVTDGEGTDAEETVASRIVAADGGKGDGHHIAVVHDDSADTVRLYVDGQLGDEASFDAPWSAEGPLQVGRGRTADGWGEYLHGAVDNVRAFTGVVDAERIPRLRY
ncbi:LamG domain-containing protein [Streptomyces fragilis]|uniref:LamG domain-containing protein n=1 Tax=Streptomyces fragilis TaxID=67301 RepID=A0ABV2YCQ1_9ACTN|nr:LamG domain-containing protein [Streptomyces fragilis]